MILRGIDVAIFVMGDTVKKTNLGLMIIYSRVTNHKLYDVLIISGYPSGDQYEIIVAISSVPYLKYLILMNIHHDHDSLEV